MSDDGLLPAALTAMATADAMPCVATIPFMWRLHLAFHGVRLSRLPQDDLATACGDMHVSYWATTADGLLAGVESAPVEVRVNTRAASFVLRTLGSDKVVRSALQNAASIASRLWYRRIRTCRYASKARHYQTASAESASRQGFSPSSRMSKVSRAQSSVVEAQNRRAARHGSSDAARRVHGR